MQNFDYLKTYRGMPWIKRGMVVEVSGRRGVVTSGGSLGNVNVRFDGSKRISNCHPHWETVYYDESGNIVADYRKQQPVPEPEKREPCPFCPLQGIEESMYETVGYDYFGKPAMIGNVPACGPCAQVAEMTDTAEEMLAELEEARKAQASA